MANFAKITDNPSLVRDMFSKAVLNTDKTVIKKHEQRIAVLQKEQAREVEINNMKNDITEIKQLLQTLLKIRV